jgi:hypothetical protein
MRQRKRAAGPRGRLLLGRPQREPSTSLRGTTASVVVGRRRLSRLTPRSGHFIGRVLRDTRPPTAIETVDLREDRP